MVIGPDGECRNYPSISAMGRRAEQIARPTAARRVRRGLRDAAAALPCNRSAYKRLTARQGPAVAFRHHVAFLQQTRLSIWQRSCHPVIGWVVTPAF